jgi:pimeloyl-ACP methyl ester carboxylesterase
MIKELPLFRVAVPEDVLADLRDRLQRTRWPDALPGAGWEFGTDLDTLRQVVAYWADRFDWSAQERELNSCPQYLADIDGTPVHAVHASSPEPNALSLVLLHGWPSTGSEFRRVIGPLVDPVAHGGQAGDAFDLIIPSLPGFGFSGPTTAAGWDGDRMARAIGDLMGRLGIDHYGVFGTDAGAYVAACLGVAKSRSVVGVHLQLGGVRITALARADERAMTDLNDTERQALDDLDRYQGDAGAYAALNTTRPQTLTYALTDSPVGQAAWIIEKFHEWTQGVEDAGPFGAISIDDVLTIVTTYWVTRTAGSAARFYAETARSLASSAPILTVPTGCAVFPGDIVRPSRRWAARVHPNIVHWTEMSRGGHFGALEAPDLLADDLRAFFRPLRSAAGR